jgi:hypothetical protein
LCQKKIFIPRLWNFVKLLDYHLLFKYRTTCHAALHLDLRSYGSCLFYDENRPGEYKFGEANPVVAHVVFVRGQPLGNCSDIAAISPTYTHAAAAAAVLMHQIVRFGDNWDELTSFILQRVQEDGT